MTTKERRALVTVLFDDVPNWINKPHYGGEGVDIDSYREGLKSMLAHIRLEVAHRVYDRLYQDSEIFEPTDQ